MDPFWVGVWVVWILLVVVSFAVIEYIGLRRSDDERPPLTQVIRRWVPRWLIAAALGAFALWGIEHFVL